MKSRLSWFVVLIAAAALAGCGSDSGSGGGPGGSGGAGHGGGGSGADGGSGGDGGSGADGGNGGQGGGAAGTDGSLPSWIHVKGSVAFDLFNFNGNDVLVILNGDRESTVVVSSTAPSFEFEDVSVPYDLAMVSFTGSSTEPDYRIDEYQGLTRSNPVLVQSWGDSFVSSPHAATVKGNVTSSRTFPLPSEEGFSVGIEGEVNPLRSFSGPGYEAEVRWKQGSLYTGTLVAVIHSDLWATFKSEFYLAGTVGGLRLTQGGTFPMPAPNLIKPVPKMKMKLMADQGAFTEPLGNICSYKILGAFFRFGSVSLVERKMPVEFDLPEEGGLLEASATAGSSFERYRVYSTKFAESSSPTVFTFPKTLDLKRVSPGPDAVDVSRTPVLSWTAVPDARGYRVVVWGPRISYRFFVPSTTTHVSLQDFEDLGTGLLPGVSYDWEVSAYVDTVINADVMTNGSTQTLKCLGFRPGMMLSAGGAGFKTAP